MGPEEGCAAETRLIAADRYVMLVPEGGGDAAAMACRLVLAAAFTSMGMQFQSIAAVASLQVREGEPVDLVIEGETLMIRAKRPHYTLEELVAAMRPEDEPEVLDDVTAPPSGDEVL